MKILGKYRKAFHIPYYDTDKDGRITSYNILKYFGETSASQTDEFSLNEEEKKSNYGWMIYRWKVKIKKYPKAKEKVYIETWISKLDRFYAYREFAILSKENEVLGVASTVWIMVDMKKKRPIRIPSTFIGKSKIVNERNFSEFENFREKIDIKEYIDFKVRRSDIDYNNHVNNTKYLLWIIEAVPNNIYEKYTLAEFEIIYKKEIKYGDMISSAYTIDKIEEDQVLYTHKITGKNSNNEHAFGKSKWIKN